MDWFKSEILSSEPIEAGNGQRITVRSHNIQLRLPLINYRAQWHRPFSVTIADEQQQERFIPVIDITRIVQILFLAAGMVAASYAFRRVK